MHFSDKIFRSGAIFSLLFLFVIGTTLGQGRRQMTEEERKEAFDANFNELSVTLELGEESATKVKEILWTQSEKQRELFASLRAGGGAGAGGGGNFARAGMREKMGELTAETKKSLSAVLGKEQMEKYTEYQASRRRGRGRGQGQRRSTPQ